MPWPPNIKLGRSVLRVWLFYSRNPSRFANEYNRIQNNKVHFNNDIRAWIITTLFCYCFISNHHLILPWPLCFLLIVLKFPYIFLYISIFLCWDFLFLFICFKRVPKCLLKHVYNDVFKIVVRQPLTSWCWHLLICRSSWDLPDSWYSGVSNLDI